MKARIIVKIHGETYKSKFLTSSEVISLGKESTPKELLLAFLKEDITYAQITLENNQELFIKSDAVAQAVFLVEEVEE